MTQESALPLDPPAPAVEESRRPVATEVLDSGSMIVHGTSGDESLQELSFIDRLASEPERAMEGFRVRAQLIEACRIGAISATSPVDWVLSKGRDDVATAMLCASGAQVVSLYFGIKVKNMRPVVDGIFQPKKEIDPETGEVHYQCWFDAKSTVTGQEIFDVEAGRSSKEQFVGRGGLDTTSALVALSDLRLSCSTLALTKSARILGALTRLAIDVLKKAGIDIEQCRKGHGYGTATERGAQTVASGDVKARAKKLGEDILARVSGDVEAARGLLKEISAGKNFAGFESVERFTIAWQLDNAEAKLKAHQVFGDRAKDGAK